jgi:hypothetical protein
MQGTRIDEALFYVAQVDRQTAAGQIHQTEVLLYDAATLKASEDQISFEKVIVLEQAKVSGD